VYPELVIGGAYMNRGAVGAEARSRRRKPPGRKGMGKGNLPSRRGGWRA